MPLVLPEQQIEIGKAGFKDYCLLDRAELGKRLSKIVEITEHPMVLAVDGPWGSGKSHFLKLWTGAHRLENSGSAQIIYVDAFENDYLDDPLVTLVGAIIEHLEIDDTKRGKAEKIKGLAKSFARPLTKVTLAALTGGLSELTGSTMAAALRSIENQSAVSVDEFWRAERTKRAAMAEFRATLESLTQSKGEGGKAQKIILIIDELDRCRPDYALTFIEVLKHFFTAPGVHFVLGTNLRELEKSVAARYGNTDTAHKYLQKFIHHTIRLNSKRPLSPSSHTQTYFNHLTANLELHKNVYRDSVEYYLGLMSSSSEASLRDVERVATSLALTREIRTHYGAAYVPNVVAGLVLIKIVEPPLFTKLRRGHLCLDEVLSFLGLGTEASQQKETLLIDIWKYYLDPLHVIEDNENMRHYVVSDWAHLDRERLISKLIEEILDEPSPT